MPLYNAITVKGECEDAAECGGLEELANVMAIHITVFYCLHLTCFTISSCTCFVYVYI